MIKRSYVEPLQDRALADSCIRGLLAQGPTLGARAAAPTAYPLRDVAATLASVESEHEEAAADACIRGMVAGLTRSSAYFDRSEIRELQLSGEPDGEGVGGIGLELAPDPAGAKIVAAIEGAPGDAAGLLAGDVLTAVDGVELRGRSLKDIVRRLRGAPGSIVAVTVQRGGAVEGLRLTLKREVIRVASIHGRLLEPGIAYLAPTRFMDTTLARFAETTARLRSRNQSAFTGLILDLRWCTGGLLDTTVGLAAAFLPDEALVVNTRGFGFGNTRSYRAAARDYLRRGRDNPLAGLPRELRSAPMVVLVGPLTGAGAEIVAAALQDHKRALVIGIRSRGFGTIETIFPVSGNTALKITTARVYRPNGEPLDGNGVAPQIIVEPRAVVGGGVLQAPSYPRSAQLGDLNDPAVAAALAFLRSSGLQRRAERGWTTSTHGAPPIRQL